MAHQLVVHCKRESYDIYIGRPSKWGNPYQSGRDGTRQHVERRLVSACAGVFAPLTAGMGLAGFTRS